MVLDRALRQRELPRDRGVGTVLTAVGLIMAGATTLRSGVWSGWRRYTPLVLGVWMVAMMGTTAMTDTLPR